MLLALVPVLPCPEGDLLLISVGGADTGLWLPRALAKRVLQLVVGGGRDIREGGVRSDLLVVVGGGMVIMRLCEQGVAVLVLVLACLVVLVGLAVLVTSRTHVWGQTWVEWSGVLPGEISTL